MSAPTRTAPARLPDGWWFAHPRYRTYVLFAGTGIVLMLDGLALILGLRALGRGVVSWQAYLAAWASPPGVVAAWLLFLGTLFFSFRWLRVGAKIPPAPFKLLLRLPTAFFLVGQFATLGLLTIVVLLILAGVIL